MFPCQTRLENKQSWSISLPIDLNIFIAANVVDARSVLIRFSKQNLVEQRHESNFKSVTSTFSFQVPSGRRSKPTSQKNFTRKFKRNARINKFSLRIVRFTYKRCLILYNLLTYANNDLSSNEDFPNFALWSHLMEQQSHSFSSSHYSQRNCILRFDFACPRKNYVLR